MNQVAPSAPTLAAFVLIVTWSLNLLGFALLLNVAGVAVLSSPGPQRIFGDPSLLLAFPFPTVWFVPVCVAGALFAHLLLFRRFLTLRQALL